MASTRHLLCFDCGRYLSLGKMYSHDENGAPLGEIRIQGIYDQNARDWHSRDELFARVLEGMLIRHRGHELRFVPEGVDELLEAVMGRSIEPLQIQDVISPKGDLDPEEELTAWRERLAIRRRP